MSTCEQAEAPVWLEVTAGKSLALLDKSPVCHCNPGSLHLGLSLASIWFIRLGFFPPKNPGCKVVLGFCQSMLCKFPKLETSLPTEYQKKGSLCLSLPTVMVPVCVCVCLACHGGQLDGERFAIVSSLSFHHESRESNANHQAWGCLPRTLCYKHSPFDKLFHTWTGGSLQLLSTWAST